jgi:peroxiredoxin
MRNRIYAAASLLVIASIALIMQGCAGDQMDPTASIGAKAPDFTLQNQDGKNVSLRDFAGKIVVLEWTNPECPFVQRHYKEKTMTTLASRYEDKGVVWLAINSGHTATNDTDKAWAAAQGISYPELNDSSGVTGKAYHATNTPDMYVIAADGTLLYSGAIDNDPDGDKSAGEKINYVQRALDEILSGKAVSTPQTKAYGCSVKYAS